MSSAKHILGKTLYALLFIGILPACLWLWSRNTEHIDLYPPIESMFWGGMMAVVGGMIMLWGMLALRIYGNGLPMNAFPPEKYVVQGPYRFVRHPIYWGFGILLVGCSIMTGSAAGLWLISPVTILSMIALVLGYERLDLVGRFPDTQYTSYLELPRNEEAELNLRDRVASFVLIFILMLLTNYVVLFLARDVLPFFGGSWEVYPKFEGPVFSYLSLFIIACIPIVLKRKDQLRKWAISMLFGLCLSVYISLLWPQVGAQYFVRDLSASMAQPDLLIVLTSVPVFMVLISFKAIVNRFPRYVVIFYGAAVVLCAYQVSQSRASLLHLITGVVIFLFAAYYLQIWVWLKDLAEKVANSWTEWVIGPVRIINHGIYVGVGAFCGILFTGWLAGKSYAWAILTFALVVIVFSAIWAQVIEGSEKLKRPFGYYGALVGIVFASLVVWGMGYNVWLIIGVVSVVAPWAQAMGRMRCLINGCCHGHPTTDRVIGIRYFHYRSRVCGLSGLKGELLHPTPLYSILWLIAIGFVLLVCWNRGLPYSFIFGLYLILTGIGRFVEEAYRGEIQTPAWNGLHLYQWTAIASLLIGIIINMIPTASIYISSDVGWEIFIAAFLGGFFTFFVMGVDFPRSNARFSRLV